MLLSVIIHFDELGIEESVRLAANLVLGSIIHAQPPSPAVDVDAQALPGEGLLEDALPQIACEEQGVQRAAA